jgi:WD40 repeat protein
MTTASPRFPGPTPAPCAPRPTPSTLLLVGLLAAAPGPVLAQGAPNEAQTPGTLLSGLNAPEQGRTAIIAYHNRILFTVPEVPSSQPGADFQVRTWDISDPTDPVELATHGITPMPINAHGYFQSGDYLILGANWPPEAPWTFRADRTGGGALIPGQLTRTTFPNLACAGVRGCLFGSWVLEGTFWSYGQVGGNAQLSRWTTWPPDVRADWDHLGQTGVIGHPFLLGDLLIYAADQSRTGVATYDVSAYMDGDPGNDPPSPPILDVLTTGGPGGYWPELWAGDGRLYVVFPYNTNGNGIRVVELTDPTNLQLVADVPLPGAQAMYMQFQDEYGFTGDHKIDMRSLTSVLDLNGANVTRTHGGGVGVDTSQFALPIGNLLVTGGVGEDEGMAIWAHQAAPDTRGPAVTWHVPQAGRTNYPVEAPISLILHETLDTTTIVNGTTFLVRPLGGNPIAGVTTFSFNDILTFVPNAPLAANTTYEVVLPAGGIRDAVGNGIEGYSFTFSTGGTVGGNLPPEVLTFTVADYPVAPNVATTLAATANDPNGDSLQYRFDFGDGRAKTTWSNTPSTNVSWPTSGHYRVTVQVRDPGGLIASRTRTATVLVPPAGAATHSGQTSCDADARAVFVANPDADTVARVDADSASLVFEAAACDDPRAVARTAQNELWVACHDDDTLRVLDADDGQPLATLELAWGDAPVGLAVSPNGATVYATLAGPGELRRFDAASRSQTGSLLLGPSPRAIAVSPNGARILVTRFVSPRDWAEVWDVSAATFTLTRTLRIDKLGGDLHRDGTASGRGTPNFLTSVAIAPDGATAWVTANKPNVERGLLFAPDLDQDNTVRNVAIRLDLGSGAVTRTLDLDNSDSASALAFSPLGDYLAITLQGNNEVLVFDTLALGSSAGLGGLVTRLGAGKAPQGICFDGPTRRGFVTNFLSRDVTVLETDGLFSAGDIVVPSDTVATVGVEPLAPAVLLGKQLFYDASPPRMSAEGYLSCATCHLDGDSDHRVWDFTGRGEGLRNTTVLNGRGGIAQGNVHWSANFDEIHDFENDIRSAFGGAGLMDDADFAATSNPLGAAKAGLSADLDALAAYVASLGQASVGRSPHRQADGSFTPEALAGHAVFLAQGCATCHAGAGLTDSTAPVATLHDVGTLRTTSGQRLGAALLGIDTPTLRGVWSSAPYFHDGSAATLEDVFVVAGGTVYPAEDGTVSTGDQRVAQYVELNNDDTVRGRAYVGLQGIGQRLTLGSVDGGAGGVGAIELRVSTAGAVNVELRVNGVGQLVALPAMGNNPSWRHTNWRAVRVENVTLAAGATNTVELVGVANWPSISVDEIVVSTSNLLAAAYPHRRVGQLSATDRNHLLAYLRELDGGEIEPPPGLPFEDGFESGDTGSWQGTGAP